jgi:uncharacterized protein (TIGR03435 family)
MAADADPAFEVATIKPHDPNRQGFGIGYRGHNFYGTSTSVRDLILLAYGLHPRASRGRVGVGRGGKIRYRSIFRDRRPAERGTVADHGARKLLRDRFGLEFHRDSKELQVYAIVAAKTGPRFLDKKGEANGRPTFGFQALGSMTVRNATIADFAGWMQRYVLDRPVVDRSGVSGRYDFVLNWTADETQFGGIAGQLRRRTARSSTPICIRRCRSSWG